MATHNIAELALEFGRLMNEMKYHLRQQIQERLKGQELDISFELLDVMGFLWRRDGINQQELADMAIKDKSSMTYLIDNLVRRKLVTRAEDEHDRRSKLIYLTREGRQLQKKLEPPVTEAYQKASAGVTRTELNNAISLVKNMTNNVRKQVAV